MFFVFECSTTHLVIDTNINIQLLNLVRMDDAEESPILTILFLISEHGQHVLIVFIVDKIESYVFLLLILIILTVFFCKWTRHL